MSSFPFIAAGLAIIAVGVALLLVPTIQSQRHLRSDPTNMRWGLWTTIVLILLLMVYFAWPLVGFYSLASAVESRNAAALAERVDFPSLRRSISQQVIAEYLKLTGKDKKLGRFRTGIATGVGAALAEPVVAQFLNAETLLDFLNKGSVKVGDNISSEIAPFSGSTWSNVWRIWWHSEYGLTRFSAYLPPDKPTDEQFKVGLSLRDLEWKLTGIGLPDQLRGQLAQELVRQKQERK
jgi:Protein of unknown function (DUF2939)